MSSEISLVFPKRSAHAAISGYIYQTCLGVLRWLDLSDDEILVCEGDEDLDRLITSGRGVGESEQVKALHGPINVRDRVVVESLRWFLLTYVALRRRGEQRRFVFTTTARLSELGRCEEALEATREAVSCLAGPFLQLPDAFRDRIKILVRNYREHAEAAGQIGDRELLKPILAILEAEDPPR